MIEITLDLNMIACWLTIFALILMCLYTYLVFKLPKACNKRFQVIYRIGIPCAAFAGYQAFWFAIGWQVWTLLLVFEVIVNLFFYMRLWSDEGAFDYEIDDLQHLGMLSLFLYFFERSMILDANVHRFKKYSTSFATVEKIIEENHLMNRKKEQFDTDEKWLQYEKSKEAYARRKAHPELYKVDVLGFYSILSGYKMLIFVHEGDLPDRIIEGNAVRVPKKTEIDGHEFEKIICLQGQDSSDAQRRMEADLDYLDIMTSLTLLESIPGMKAQIAKKDEIIEQQQDTMENMKDDVIISEKYLKYNKPTTQQTFDMRRFGFYILGIFGGLAGLLTLLIVLMHAGVI